MERSNGSEMNEGAVQVGNRTGYRHLSAYGAIDHQVHVPMQASIPVLSAQAGKGILASGP